MPAASVVGAELLVLIAVRQATRRTA
jgi:hypothetical protein